MRMRKKHDDIIEFILHFNYLQQLYITRIPSLTSFPSNDLPKALKTLYLRQCENLEFPTHEFHQSCNALEELGILTLLSAAVEAMIGKITTEISEFYRSKNLDESLLEKLESTMRILQAFLSDAEEKQIKNAAVKAWLDDLTQALFDADDLLDDVATEALRRKVEARYVPRRSLAVKVRKVLCYPFKRPYGEINSQMQKLIERLNGFAERAHMLPLEKGVSGSDWRTTPTNSAVDDSAICGRDDERKNLKDVVAVVKASQICFLKPLANDDCWDMFNHFGELDSFHGLKGLRTLIALPFYAPYRSHYLANGVLQELLALKQLRVLSLSNYRSITLLPNSIGDLKHLRHLDLSCTGIERLPPAICKLYNLQTLLLSDCRYLTELPEEMGKFVNLRHLAIDNCGALTKLPEGMGKLVNLRCLDIDGSNLQEMPVEIAILENLQSLSGFIVSKQQHGLKLAEMRKFPHLQGKLCISKLENVIDPSDACQANLKEKKKIEELSLEWSDSILEDSHQVVLEHLQPSTSLKNLSVKCYGGSTFPSWLGDSSFGNIVSLSIEDCRHCSSLPPLGRLQSLKELFISGMRSVKRIGSEFYGSNSPSFQPFPSLETLIFASMAEWEEWNMIDGITSEFPRLSKLSLSRCPKLKGNLPSNLPCLVTLVVEDCCLLESEFSGEVDNRNIMRPMNVFNFNSLRQLYLFDIPSLTSFPSNGLPKALKTLFITNCENLEFQSHEFLQSCKALEDLDIMRSCCSLTSFPLGSLPLLKHLKLRDCKNLKSISILEEEAASQSLKFLEHLQVEECPEVESISLLDLSTPNLSYFAVVRCDKINSLPEPINNLTGLQTLYLYDVPNLESIAEEGLPINLRTLGVGNEEGVCSNTAITKWGLDRLTSLSYLSIKGEYQVKKLMEIQKSEPRPPSPLFCLIWSLPLPSSPALAAGLSASPGVILSLSPSLVYSQYLSSLFASFASERHRSLCCRRGTRVISFSIVILSESASSFSIVSSLHRCTSRVSIEPQPQDKINNQIEDCFSCTSSNRESWGKCSSLGGNDEDLTIVDVFATSLRSMKEKCSEPKEDEQKLKKNKNKIKKKKKKKGETADKKGKGDRFEKLEALSRRLRHCLLKGSIH
ncbi:hypothetical protein Ahy_A01g003967 [Arachis hypogaea]|uniref:Uncharacterized protein n=1 Tax=Arachis hypogaea TaxID=3818 RepID=A0A445EUC5_ARAHY|nr:hypothetical protein Ahy_A01g003967 [Arachis hypogaea]